MKAAEKKIVTLFFDRNFNAKLNCHYMIHIAQAPKPGTLKESFLENTIIEIKTKDGSFAPSRWKLTDTLHLKLHELRSFITYPSHGVDCFAFAKQFLQANPSLSMNCEMCVYYYEKQSD